MIRDSVVVYLRIGIYVTQNQSTTDGIQGKKCSIFRMKLRLEILEECSSSYTQNTAPRRTCQSQSRREGRPLDRPLTSDFNK
jgi:hypothetical protein